MTRPLTRDEVREVDRRAVEELGLPGIVLMENAGRGVAEILRDAARDQSVVVCCGKGNNGGDGFVVARHLDNAGVNVRVLLFADPDALEGDAATNYEVLEKSGTPIQVFHDGLDPQEVRSTLSGADWIVDALLGTGMRGAVREPFATVVEAINASSARVLAVDIPSGLDCDTGEAAGHAVRADRTVTFVAPKVGFANPSAKAGLGAVDIVDIGVPRRLLPDE